VAQKKEAHAASRFESATKDWEAERDRIIADYAAKLEAYEKELVPFGIGS
jgi:hypothetical protein